MPMVAGSGPSRGRRGLRVADRAGMEAISAMPRVHFLERDEVAVGVAHHEPAGAPLRLLRFHHDVRALRERAEARVDVVDVEVHVRPRALEGLARPRLGEHYLHRAAGEDRATVGSVSTPGLGHRPAEDIAIEADRL